MKKLILTLLFATFFFATNAQEECEITTKKQALEVCIKSHVTVVDSMCLQKAFLVGGEDAKNIYKELFSSKTDSICAQYGLDKSLWPIRKMYAQNQKILQMKEELEELEKETEALDKK